MDTQIFISFINNIALLLALWAIYGVTLSRSWPLHPVLRKVITGSMIGAIGVAVMSSPLKLSPGVIFDTRSILLSISGLFFGGIPTLVAAIMTTIYRLYDGGAGAWTGVGVIVTSAGIGLGWRYRRPKHGREYGPWELYLFGIIVHVVMLLMMLTLPWETAVSVLRQVSLPVMLIYPLGTVLLGLLFSNQLKTKNLSQELAASEARYRALVETADDVILLTDLEGNHLYRNPAYYTSLGFEDGGDLEPVGFLRVHPDDEPQVRTGIQQVIKAGATTTEYRVRHRDGHWVYRYAKSRLLRDENAHPYAILAIIRDVTNRKTAEQALQESEERLTHVLEGSQLGYWDWDIETGHVERNERWAEMLGYTLEEIKLNVQQWTDLHHPDDKEAAWQSIQDHLEGRTPSHNIEYRMRTKDGNYKWILDQAMVVKRDSQGKPLRMSGTHTDITKRKRIEEELNLSQVNLSIAIQAANLGLWDWDLNTNQVKFSAEWKKQIGYEEHEISNHFDEWQSRVHPEDLEPALARVNAFLENPQPNFHNEFRLQHKDGSYRWILAQANLLRDNEGQPLRMIGSHIDITQRKLSEEKIKAQSELLMDMSRIAKIGGWEFDAVTQTGSWTAETARIHDLDPENETNVELGLSFYKGEYRRRIEEAVDQAIQYGTPYDLELQLTTPAGTQKWVRTIGRPVFEGDQVIAVRGTFQDITERKRVEADRDEAHEKFQSVFDLGPVATTLSRISDRVIIDVNEATVRLLGYTREELIGKPSLEIDYWMNPEERQRAFQIFIEQGKLENFEFSFQTKTGATGQAVTDVRMIEIAGEAYLLSTIVDITTRKKAEEELQKFVMLANSSSEFIGMCDLDLTPLYVNPAGMRMVGLSDLETACSVKVQDYFFPEDQAFISEEFFPRVLREGHGEVEIRLRHFQTGEPILMLYYLFHVRNASGEVIGWATVSRDITERNKTQRQLERSEEEFRMAFENSASGMCLTGLDGQLLRVNPTMAEMFGYEIEEMTGQHFNAITLPEDQEIGVSKVREMIAGDRDRVIFEKRYLKKDGEFFWARIHSAPIRDTDGQVQHFITQLENIHQLKLAQQALEESEERLRLSTELGKVAVWEYDFLSNTMSRSKNHDQLYGLDWQEIWDINTFLKATHPKDRDFSNAIIQNSVGPGGPDQYSFDFRVVYPDQSVHWLAVTGRVIVRDPQGHGLLVRGTLIDITDRKQVEADLIESEQRYRSLFVNMNAGFVLFEVVQDDQGAPIDLIIRAGNKGFESTTGLKMKDVTDQLLTKALPGIEHDEADWIGKYGQVALTGEAVQFEQGSEFLGVFYSVNAYQSGPNLCAVTFVDITERKRAETALKESHEELRTLTAKIREMEEIEKSQIARELHDQIGQTMTALNINIKALSTILRHDISELAMHRLEDSEMLTEQAIRQIRNIMIELRPPGLDDFGLVAALRWFGEQFTIRTGIQMQVSGDGDIRLSPHEEITLFRIAQEALNNIAKHAQARHVWVNFETIANTALLEITDDGIGFENSRAQQPDHISWGLLTMRERAESINGHLRISTPVDGGTKIIVEVNL